MKDMNEVYKKIKNNYPKIKVRLEENEKITSKFSEPYKIIVNDSSKEIVAYEYFVELVYKNKIITHCHPDNYDDLYDSIIYYLKEDPVKIEKIIKKSSFITRIILILIILIFSILIELVSK